MAFGGIVQSNGGSIVGVSSFSGTLGSAITAGNLVFMLVTANNVPSGANTGWTKSTGMSPVANAQGLGWWFIATGGDTIPSITFASATNGNWRCVEYEGPFDASPYLTSAGAATNGSISTIATSSITPTTGVGALVLGLFGGQSGADASWNIASNSIASATNSFTNFSQQWRQAATEAHLSCQSSLVVGSTSGSYTTTGTVTTNSTSGGSCRVGMTIAFKQGAGGGGSTTPLKTIYYQRLRRL